MTRLNEILTLLQDQRRDLLDQLDATDRAIAALGAVEATGSNAPPAEPDSVPADTASPEPARLKPKRVLTDSHRQALLAGRRKARHSHDVAKGVSREQPDDAFVPAIGTRKDSHSPRLVKRPAK